MKIPIWLLFIVLLPCVAFAEISDEYLNEILSRHINDITHHVFYNVESESDEIPQIVDFSKSEGKGFLTSTPVSLSNGFTEYHIKVTLYGESFGMSSLSGRYYINLGRVWFHNECEYVFDHNGNSIMVVTGTFQRTHLNKYAKAWDAFLVRTTGASLKKQGGFVFTFIKKGDSWFLR